MHWAVSRTVAIACAVLCGSVWGQEVKKNWKDREEYSLYESIAKESVPAKKLELLNTWKQKYPQSDFAKERLTLYINTYAQMQNFAQVIESAKEILKLDPADLTALYWITSLTPKMNKTDADFLDTGEKAANALLSNLDTIFADAKRPQGTPPEGWKKARNDMEILALKTLGWISMQRKQNDKAEEQLRKLLEKQPKDGEASYWLYTVTRTKVEKQSEALFHLARAASLPASDGGLPDASRKQVDDFFVKAYNRYHGEDAAGLQELRKLALASPFPPDGFKIETAAEIAARKEEEFKKEKPQLAFWMGIKKELEGDGGMQFFEERMKGAALPGQIEGTPHNKLKGKVVSHKPAVNPKEILLAMDTETPNAPAVVTLKLETPLRGKADPGTEIEFEGVAAAFTKDPFMLTFEVESDNIVGWPAPPPPPAKKAASKAKGTRKKK